MSDSSSFWRKEDPELGPDGKVVRGGFFEPQRRWWNLDTFCKLIVGGYGAGKSLVLGKRAISSVLHNAPVPTLCIEPTYRMARDVMLPTITELLDGKATLLRGLSYSVHKTQLDITIRYRGRVGKIMIRSGEDPRALKGPNCGPVYIDEPFIQDVEVLHQALARARHPNARLLEIGLAGTPEQLNWGVDLAQGELGQKYNCGVVVAPTRSNKALPAGYVERLAEGYSKEMQEAFLEGKFVMLTSGRIYCDYKPSEHDTDDPDLAGAELFVGMDFNVNPMAFLVGARLGDRVHFLDEWEEPDSNTEHACAKIRERYPHVALCYPDPSGRARKTSAAAGVTDFAILRDSGFEVIAPQKAWARRDRFAAVNARFRAGQITVGPRCRKLRSALVSASYQEESTAKGKARGHLLDAMGYPIAWMFPLFGRPEVFEMTA